jgi:hypothetical protein
MRSSFEFIRKCIRKIFANEIKVVCSIGMKFADMLCSSYVANTLVYTKNLDLLVLHRNSSYVYSPILEWRGAMPSLG